MIEPSRALRELLDEHEALRDIMDDCEQLADNIDAGRGNVGELVLEVSRLRAVFDAHNKHEEQVLPAILRAADAFGDVRIAHMTDDHVDEHRALRDRLDGPTRELRATLYELRAHLVAEERMFLSARVLCDDIINVEASG